MYYPTCHPDDPEYKNRKKRRERMEAARAKGRHTREQWLALKAHFRGRCVRCVARRTRSGLKNVERDHIVPIYQGGSDGIDNIQPSCALCNAQKGPEAIDHRPLAAARLGVCWPPVWWPTE